MPPPARTFTMSTDFLPRRPSPTNPIAPGVAFAAIGAGIWLI